MKSGLAEEDEVDFVILSSVKHDLNSPTLKWADQWFHYYSAHWVRDSKREGRVSGNTRATYSGQKTGLVWVDLPSPAAIVDSEAEF